MALNLFLDNIKGKDQSVDQHFKDLKGHFITGDRQHRTVIAFNTITFQDMRKEGIDDSHTLDRLYEKAKTLQIQLGKEYAEDKILRDMLIRATAD